MSPAAIMAAGTLPDRSKGGFNSQWLTLIYVDIGTTRPLHWRRSFNNLSQAVSNGLASESEAIVWFHNRRSKVGRQGWFSNIIIDHLTETWHPHPTRTLASRPGMSLEKVRRKYFRQKRRQLLSKDIFEVDLIADVQATTSAWSSWRWRARPAAAWSSQQEATPPPTAERFEMSPILCLIWLFFEQVTGSLETKYKIKEHGLSLTEKWTTDNR